MEVSQRQKEFAESQKIQVAKNKTLTRENTRLKAEVKVLRQEMGLKPEPEIHGMDVDDDFGPA